MDVGTNSASYSPKVSVPSSMAMIPQAMLDLETSIDMLRSAIDRIETKTEPVRNQQTTPSEKQGESNKAMPSLAARIYASTIQINGLRNRLNTISDEIEL